MCERAGRIAISEGPQNGPAKTAALSVLSQLLQIAGLANLAIAQPVFALLGDNPSFFVAHRTSSTELVFFVALLSWVLPAALVALTQPFRLMGHRSHSASHYSLLAFLFCALSLTVARHFPPPPEVILLGFIFSAGIAFALAVMRFSLVRFYLKILSLVAVGVPIIFLLTTPAFKTSLAHEYSESPFPEKNSTTPVVFLIFDALPQGSLQQPNGDIDAGLFPNFALFAEDSYWFRNTTTVSLWTDVAVPAILTGKYPNIPHKERPAAVASNYPENLFSLFSASRSLLSHETMTQLAPPASERIVPKKLRAEERLLALLSDTSIIYAHLITPPALATRLPSLFGRWKGFSSLEGNPEPEAIGPREQLVPSGDGERPLTVRKFIASLQKPSEPMLYYLHLSLPHVPYEYLPSGQYYGPVSMLPQGNLEGSWGSNSWLVASAQQRHLLQVGYTDKILGQITQALKGAGLYEKSLFIITSDHGVAFREEHPIRGVDPITGADTLAVPLFIKKPHQKEGVIRDDNAQTIDILPSLVDILEVDTPWHFDGRSLFNDPASEPPRKQVRLLGGKTLDFPARLSLEPSLEVKFQRFGFGSWERVYAVGPFPQLIGEKVIELALSPTYSSFFFRLEASETYQSVDSSAAFCPAFVRGFLVSSAGESWEGQSLVIAVNGIIQAQSEAFLLHGTTQFSAMMPESAFQDGNNSVEVFGVEERKGKLTLRRILPMVQPPS